MSPTRDHCESCNGTGRDAWGGVCPACGGNGQRSESVPDPQPGQPRASTTGRGPVGWIEVAIAVLIILALALIRSSSKTAPAVRPPIQGQPAPVVVSRPAAPTVPIVPRVEKSSPRSSPIQPSTSMRSAASVRVPFASTRRSFSTSHSSIRSRSPARASDGSMVPASWTRTETSGTFDSTARLMTTCIASC